MPRMLAPRRDSLSRRSGASLNGSRSSLNGSFAGSVNSRRASLNNHYYGSHLSLRRSSMNNGSAQSSSHSIRQQALYHHRTTQQTSPQINAVWNIEDQSSVASSQQAPSLLGSETSVQTDDHSSGSRSSSQSSLQPPPRMPPTNNAARYEAMHRYFALRRNLPQHQPPGSTPGSLHYPHSRSLPGSPGNTFLAQTQIKEDDAWGQFVDMAEAEEELVRRSKLISLTRRYPVTLSHSGPGRLRR